MADTQKLDSKMSYVVAQLFLEKMLARTQYEDLVVLVSGMCLSMDGERSMDPAMVNDWAGVVGDQASFKKTDAFLATRAYQQNWYEIGPQEEIKRVIDSMAVGPSEAPLDRDVARDWNLSWETVCNDLADGNPFKTALGYSVDANGKTGHLEWRAGGGLSFVEDDVEK